jgi:hypothetical protein
LSGRTPDFIVIGAMKCATTTLHEQLARQPGVVMSRPKEPNYFSDDANYARGPGWYAAHFRGAAAGDLCGESSTHYTKRPTYPDAVARMARDLPRVKLIYMMRHPLDRLVSQYHHERNVGRITVGLDQAVGRHPELVDYGRYAMQLEPYLDRFGPDQVLPVFFRRLAEHPQAELERIGRFLGRRDRFRWDPSLKPQNVGAERLRRSSVRETLVRLPLLTPLRQRLIPRGWYAPLRSAWRDRTAPPSLGPEPAARLRRLYDDDLARLGDRLGLRLCCENFSQLTRTRAYDWVR